jgi:hypothetical protein
LVLPVLVPARTGPRRPSERMPSSSSPTRVKGSNHVFGECRGTTTHFILYFSKDRWWSAQLLFCTVSRWTTTPTSTMSTNASGSIAGYVSVLRYLVRCCINNLLVSIIYRLLMLRIHKHIHDVTNLLIIALFWIKLLLKLPKFLTI